MRLSLGEDFNWVKMTSFGVGIGLSVAVACKLVSSHLHRRALYGAIEKRKKERLEGFRRVRNYFEDNVEENRALWMAIAEMTCHDLLEKLRTDEISPMDALHAYQWQAFKAQEKTNCVTMFLSEAERDAYDLEVKFGGKDSKPPLYGLPVSIKENIGIKDHDCTAGFAQFLHQPLAEDSVVVETLRSLGAIPFVQTNVPQTLFAFMAANPIYGTTCHPLNPNRTPGGSSGGEAALIASKGSLLGFGSDIAGSIRLPAAWTGIVGFRPTSLRMSRIGTRGAAPGTVMIGASDGPMAQDVDTVVTVLRHFWAPDSLLYDRDPYVVPLPFNDGLFGKTDPLTIGYYFNDGWAEATPAVKRAIEEAKKLLEEKGHKLVPYEPPEIEKAVSLLFGAILIDNGLCILDTVKKDIPEPMNRPFIDYLTPSVCRKRLMAWLLSSCRPRYSKILGAIPKNNMEIRKIYAAVAEYRLQVVRSFKEVGLDCLICPANISAAMPHHLPAAALHLFSPTFLYNVVDFPGGVVPVTTVTSEDEQAMKDFPAEDYPTKAVKKAASTGSVGLPVGVQCVSLPFREEVCLRVMKDIEGSLEDFRKTLLTFYK